MVGRLLRSVGYTATVMGAAAISALGLMSNVPLFGQTWAAITPSLTPLAQADPATPMDSRPTLRLGSVGEAVTELQAMLTLLGYYGGPIDGFYREQTQTAVRQFQTTVEITADGIVGPTTWQKLLPPPAEVPTANVADDAPRVVATAPPPSPAVDPVPQPAPEPPQPTAPEPSPAPEPPQPVAQPTPQPEPAESAPVAVGLPVLREGVFGPAVTRLQERLAALDAYGGPIDGIFGSQTAAAVEKIQRQHNLTVDGIVGPATWSVIFK